MKKSIVYYTLALALMPLTVFGFSLDEPENMNEQTGYYYQGKKIPLTLNEYKNCICIPKDSVGIKDRILANISILDIINDNAFFLYIVHVSDYQKLTSMDFWEKDSKSIITTQCYFFDRGIEVFTDPYIIVGLKKEEDRSILESYSEQYGFKIVRNEPLMPLYYILSITPICKMNTLECANKLYETGLFASSEPDLMSVINKSNGGTPTLVDETAIQPVQVLETKYYNITGQTMDSPSGLILVVTRYSDGTVSTEKKLF